MPITYHRTCLQSHNPFITMNHLQISHITAAPQLHQNQYTSIQINQVLNLTYARSGITYVPSPAGDEPIAALCALTRGIHSYFI